VQLRSAVCLPLVAFHPRSGRKHVMGLIYADTMMPDTRLPSNVRPTLQMLTQLITSITAKWQKVERMQRGFISCERSLTSMQHDVSDVAGQLDVLLQRIEEPARVRRLSKDELRLDLQALKRRLEALDSNLRRLQHATRQP